MAKILLADDSSFMRSILKKIVESDGHTVISETSNGEEAFKRYVELKPDLVIMDITMPDVTGLEGLKMIKIMDKNAKVIMCSAMGQGAMMEEAFSYGALDFIVKPLKKDQVIDVINNILKNK